MESGSNSQCSSQNNQIMQNDKNKQIKLRTKDSFKKVDSLNDNENDVENNQPPTSTLRMQQVLNKFRPYLSLPDDEKNLIICLNNLGVKCIYDLLLLDFEKDLQGILNVIQCRKLSQELINDVSMQHANTLSVRPNISIPSAVEQALWTQLNALSTMPQFTSSVIKSLENGTVSNDDQREIVESLSKYMFDVVENPGMRDCRKIVSLLEKRFPNGFRNKDSRFNVEYISKQVVQRIYYLRKKKQQLELKQNGLLPQNDCTSSKMSKQKKLMFGTHPDRYLPVNPAEGQMFSRQEQVKTWLKSTYLVFYVTKLETMDKIDWDLITCQMRNTYAAQRKMITNSEPINKILEDWPFLGKGQFLKDHFYYLINKDNTALKKCNEKVPFILKFVEAEAEKEQKDVDLQIRLKAIIRKKNMKNYNNAFLTIILCCMAIMKENVERMFIILEDSNSFEELQSNAKLIPNPVVGCLGDIWSNGKCYVFIGKHCLWHEPMSVNEAIQIMFMAYYAFDFIYSKELAGILQFIQRFLFNINDEGNRAERRPPDEKYVPKLLKLVVDYESYCEKNCT